MLQLKTQPDESLELHSFAAAATADAPSQASSASAGNWCNLLAAYFRRVAAVERHGAHIAGDGEGKYTFLEEDTVRIVAETSRT